MAVRKKNGIYWDRFFSFGAFLVSLGALYISYVSYRNSIKVQMENIIPRIQIKPVDVEEQMDCTIMKFDVLNYSEYIANNIYVDIKIGDRSWKSGISKAVGKNVMRRLKLDFVLNDRPTYDKLMPGKSIKLSMWDENKEYWQKQEMYWSSDGTSTLIPSTEISKFIGSMGWKEELEKACSGEPIKILFRVIWENEIGKKFDVINEYEIECVKIDSVRNYSFTPLNIKEYF